MDNRKRVCERYEGAIWTKGKDYTGPRCGPSCGCCKPPSKYCKGILPYQSHNAKHQINVMIGWVGLKMSPLTLFSNMYTFFTDKL